MNAAAFIRPALAGWLVFWIAACTSLEQRHETGTMLLVTVAQTEFHGAAVALGSSQAYRAGGEWEAPLRVREALRQIRRDHGLTEIDGWPIVSLGRYCAVMRLDPDQDAAGAIAVLQADPRVLDAQRMHQFDGLLAGRYDDPHFELQYGSHAPALSALHQLTTGRGVRVGIIDTPVDVDHPDLDGQIHRQHRFVETRVGVHGTAIAGVIAAAVNNGRGVVGLSPDARIEVFGACNEQEGRSRCTSFDLAKALEHAIARHMDIINMSLSGPHDPLLTELLRVAAERGVLVIAARDDSADGGFPASLPSVVGVDVSSDAVQWFRRGEQLSTQAGGGYQYFRGSSVAAAGVSGLAALLRSETDGAETRDFIEALVGRGCGAQSSGSIERAVLVGGCDGKQVSIAQ